jgi:transposase-like protein
MSESTKQRKTYRPQSEWQRIIDDYQRSGLTQEAFCDQASIAKSSFYKWRKRLERPAVTDEPARFIDLSTLVKPKEPPRWEIELDLGNGMRLSLRGG